MPQIQLNSTPIAIIEGLEISLKEILNEYLPKDLLAKAIIKKIVIDETKELNSLDEANSIKVLKSINIVTLEHQKLIEESILSETELIHNICEKIDDHYGLCLNGDFAQANQKLISIADSLQVFFLHFQQLKKNLSLYLKNNHELFNMPHLEKEILNDFYQILLAQEEKDYSLAGKLLKTCISDKLTQIETHILLPSIERVKAQNTNISPGQAL